MIPRLQRLFDALEKDRSDILQIVSGLPAEQFHRTLNGSWSLSQILSHLIAAERLSIQYMKKKILGIKETGDTGVWEEVKMILLKLSQRLPLKYHAPRMVVEHTPSYAGLNELTADWEEERRQLRELLEQFKSGETEKKIYKHVRAGRLNIRHALIFFREHYIHHLPQMRKYFKDPTSKIISF